MSWVSVPVYKGFDIFAISPCQQTVNELIFRFPCIISVLVQVVSCYGLLSTNPIMSPVATGRMVTLPYYPGCKYVAYAAKYMEEV